MCGAEELQDDMSLKQVYLMNWSPRVSEKKNDIIKTDLFISGQGAASVLLNKYTLC